MEPHLADLEDVLGNVIMSAAASTGLDIRHTNQQSVVKWTQIAWDHSDY